uniref:Uncharacterized protein n=1 Tax=Cucumis melo TaxID=3656 RepID=A0A9I9EBH5_CUCME
MIKHLYFAVNNLTSTRNATRRTSPCKPMATEPMAIAAGPAINFNTISTIVSVGPQAINFSCNAMKIPASD